MRVPVKAKGKPAPVDGKLGYTLTGSDGHTLQSAYNAASDLPIMSCDGKPREWSKELDIYRPLDAKGPVSLGCKTGELRVEAGGKVFTCTVSAEGKVTFENK